MDCSLCIHHHHVKFSPWSFHFFVTCISKKYLVQTCIQSCVLLEFPSNLDFSVGKMNLFFKLEETATWQCGLDDGQSYAQKKKVRERHGWRPETTLSMVLNTKTVWPKYGYVLLVYKVVKTVLIALQGKHTYQLYATNSKTNCTETES